MMSRNYWYNYFRITIGMIKNDKLIYVNSKFSSKRNIIFEKLIKAGKYIILVEPTWDNEPFKYNIGTYSS